MGNQPGGSRRGHQPLGAGSMPRASSEHERAARAAAAENRMKAKGALGTSSADVTQKRLERMRVYDELDRKSGAARPATGGSGPSGTAPPSSAAASSASRPPASAPAPAPASAASAPVATRPIPALAPPPGDPAFARGDSKGDAKSTSAPPSSSSSSSSFSSSSSSVDLEAEILRLSHESPATVALLRRVLTNLLGGADAAKFRKIKLASEKMRALVLDVPGALDVFQTIGFEKVTLPSPAGELEDYLYFREETSQETAALVLAGLADLEIASS